MTWKRRKRLGLACGSSRVLTMGRRCIVSTLCNSLKKSLRCEIWKSGRDKLVLLFDGEFARAGNDLARDQEGLDAAGQFFPRQRARQQVILMAAVAVPAEIGVVLVKADGRTALLGKLSRAAHQDAFAGAVLGDQFLHRAAFRRAIFRMGVIVVIAGAVAQHQVALDFDEAQFPLRVLGEVRWPRRCPGAIPRRESRACRRAGPRTRNPSA